MWMFFFGYCVLNIRINRTKICYNNIERNILRSASCSDVYLILEWRLDFIVKGFKFLKQKPKAEKPHNYPILDLTIDQVRNAIRTFTDQLPKGVYRTILVKNDNEIDFNQLAHILGGLPSEKFYMSKETYDLFTENEKLIAYEMDIVQRAVDQYFKENKTFPVLPFDPLKRINYFELTQKKFLKTEPQTQFYLTDLDGMVTHIKPKATRR